MSRDTLHGFWQRRVHDAADGGRGGRATSTHGERRRAGRRGARRPPRPGRAARRPAPPRGRAALAGPRGPAGAAPEDTEQAHVHARRARAVAGTTRGARALAVLNTALGGGPELAAVPAGAGAARAGVLGVLVVGVATPTPAPSRCTRGARRSGSDEVVDGRPRTCSPRSRPTGSTPAEVVRAQGNLRGGLVLGLEDTPSRMNRIGRSELDYGRQRTVADEPRPDRRRHPGRRRRVGARAAGPAVHGGRGRPVRRRGRPPRPAAWRRPPRGAPASRFAGRRVVRGAGMMRA